MDKNPIKLIFICICMIPFLFFPRITSATVWNVPEDFATIQDAVDSVLVVEGDVIIVAPGSHMGAIIDRPVTIVGSEGAMITLGVPYKAGSVLKTAFLLESGADGTEISHLLIPNNASSLYFFAVFSRGVDNISLHHLTISNSVQAISNYNGSNWSITHNKIFGTNPVNGGGIGIMINAWNGTQDVLPDSTEANNNTIAFNTTEGVADVLDFSGPGILLSSGHGANQWPGGTLTGNKIYKNKCAHTGTNGVGFEVDDVPYELTSDPSIVGNTVAFNDFRNSTYQLVWNGDEEMNDISRNLGLHRGEGPGGITPHDIFF